MSLVATRRSASSATSASEANRRAASSSGSACIARWRAPRGGADVAAELGLHHHHDEAGHGSKEEEDMKKPGPGSAGRLPDNIGKDPGAERLSSGPMRPRGP